MNLNLKKNDDGNLSIGGADALDLAEEYGTPLYVMDEDRIRDNYNRINQAFSSQYSNFKIFYACKANTNLAVMRILEESGIGLPEYYEWRSRSGCYFCFFQQRIEWVGLSRKHPEKFQQALEIAAQCGLTRLDRV